MDCVWLEKISGGWPIKIKGRNLRGLKMKLFTLALFFLVSCFSYVSATESKWIGELAAKKLAIEKYHHLFANKYYINPVDSKYYRFPELTANYFRIANKTDCCWVLVGEPPAGVYISAKVDLKGNWVEIERVGFASR